jgi:cyclopropane fatty-acyl-phospholipid synthase-like methyltransferase
MAQLFDPHGNSKRLHAPATARNRNVIFEVLSTALPSSGTIFEVASGTGEHGIYMAPKLPEHHWQPSDIDPSHLASINAWRDEMQVENMRAPREFNVLEHDFHQPALAKPLSAILAINLIHIAPWSVADTLIAKAGEALKAGGLFYLYGPYKRDGEHTSDSNAAFDVSLKSRNESWGVRDMETVIAHTEAAGFSAPEITAMPANNFSLVFYKN